MIEFDLLRDQGVLIVSPKGPLAEADFARLAQEVDPFIAENKKLAGMMVCVESFPGWENFGALISHLEFVRDHHRKIDRIAAVTDSESLKLMTQVAEGFVSAEVRQFPAAQRTEALAWLRDRGVNSPTNGTISNSLI